MKQAKPTPPPANRQTAPQSDIIVSDTLYQLEPNNLKRHLIGMLKEVMKAQGETVIVIRTN